MQAQSPEASIHFDEHAQIFRINAADVPYVCKPRSKFVGGLLDFDYGFTGIPLSLFLMLPTGSSSNPQMS